MSVFGGDPYDKVNVYVKVTIAEETVMKIL